jgi:ADP-ribose pyrophosphatase YjhB (NUDIX family)
MTIWAPRTTVAAIVEEAGRFLVVEEADESGNRVLNQPAGHLEEGETLQGALVRELMEETGWEARPEGLVGIYKWRVPETGVTYLRYCFYARAVRQRHASPPDSDILAAHWMTAGAIREASARHRSPMVNRCLDDYLVGARFGLEIVHELD